MMRGSPRYAVFTVVGFASLCLPAQGSGPELIQRLEGQEKWREKALRDYEGIRKYVVISRRFGEAAMGVRVQYEYPGSKDIQVLWQSGSRTLQSRVMRKLIEAELEAASAEMRDQTRFHTGNYDFQPLGAGTVNGRAAYAFELRPKLKKKFLVRGRVWVDAEDAAIVRIDGAPVSTGFWVRNVRMLLEYRKVDGFWMIASNRSRADVRLFGPASLAVEYSEYRVNRSLVAMHNGKDQR